MRAAAEEHTVLNKDIEAYSYLGALRKPEFSALVRFLKDLGGFRLLFATFSTEFFTETVVSYGFLRISPEKPTTVSE